MRSRAAGRGGVLACLLLVLAGCGSSARPDAPPPPLVVGSFDFPESRVLAQVYGQAVRAAGHEVRIEEALGPRELVLPALREGQVDLVPEYVGGLADAVAPQVRLTAASAPDVLADVLERDELVALEPAQAQNANVLVVTAATAARLRLQRTSDLAPHAPALGLGGPPECERRAQCLPGYRATYGLTFQRFVPLDVGGPVTLSALEEGAIDVAVMFSSDPALLSRDLVMLADDRALQPPQNIVPVLRAARLDPEVRTRLDDVSDALTQDALRELNERAAAVGPERAARDWLDRAGLLQP